MVAAGEVAKVPGCKAHPCTNLAEPSPVGKKRKGPVTATIERGPPNTSGQERPPNVVITIHQGGNQGARGHVRVEGGGLYIVKAKLYHDKIRYIVASEERRFYREVDVKMIDSSEPAKMTRVILEANNEYIEEFVDQQLA
ncbi:uncharacterized protein LOC111266465 [Varroa jacobsoni]|uniref:uncharacterized protein LOC111266465 n=1 Tax=Varroa jacobsoni TaxID=62625 RepID=UPI000BF76D78|nr:uncharacterized protein LOC111266465 [Varroa jacobsoni]